MVKVISLSEEAYSRLKRLKKTGMSFSDVVVQNLEEPRKTGTIAGLIEKIERQPKPKKKEDIVSQIDKIAYGV